MARAGAARGEIQMTEGSLWKNILIFSIPLVFSQLLQVMFNMADVAVVGKFASDTALGSVGSTSTLVTLFTGFLIGMGNGVNVRVAQHLGAQHREETSRAVHTAFLLCLLAGLLSMAGRISREITQPLALLTDAIKQMDADPTHMRHVPEAGNADFQMLSASLNRMLRRETRLTHELLEANRNLYESELTQKHLELQFLRSQINPHFLYNTLETIHSIAVVRRVPEAALAAKNLAKLLRYSIKGGEIMPLASELEIIQCYLSIQRLRFGDRIRAEFDVEESVKDLCIPRMCLQPLVENAVVHGLESSIEPGMLSVVCRRDERSLWITVRDTGVGIDPEELARINRLLSNPFEKTPQQGSIGMLNVARRLHLSMGDDFSMQVASERNRGTTVSLRIPLAKLEQKGAGADVSSSAG